MGYDRYDEYRDNLETEKMMTDWDYEATLYQTETREREMWLDMFIKFDWSGPKHLKIEEKNGWKKFIELEVEVVR